MFKIVTCPDNKQDYLMYGSPKEEEWMRKNESAILAIFSKCADKYVFLENVQQLFYKEISGGKEN